MPARAPTLLEYMMVNDEMVETVLVGEKVRGSRFEVR